jgi:hypothetical protein
MSEQTLRLAEDADLDHENARDWYDSYGWHLTTENEGDLTLDVVEYHWLNEPDQEVVNHIRETYYDLTDEEVMSRRSRRGPPWRGRRGVRSRRRGGCHPRPGRG